MKKEDKEEEEEEEEKNMKKIVILGLVAIMAVGLLAGCGKKSDSGKDFDDSKPITPISREDGSGTRGAFDELAGIVVDDKSNLVADADIQSSTNAVMTSVAGNKYGIGYVSLGSLNDTIKAIKVDGVEASEETIKDKTYKISRPFLLLTKKADNELVKDLNDFILSKEGQEIVSKEGYVTVSDDAKSYEAKNLSGKLVIVGSTSVGPLMTTLADEYQKLNSKVKIEIQEQGSSAGIKAAIDGKADIGMSSRELKEEETKEGLKELTIALDGIAVVVNKENPISDLTLEHITKIYTGEIKNWADVK